jgi:hypothetical protein
MQTIRTPSSLPNCYAETTLQVHGLSSSPTKITVSGRVVGIEHTNSPHPSYKLIQQAMTNDDISVLQISDEYDLLVSSQPPSQGGSVSAGPRDVSAAILLQPFGVHLGSSANVTGKAAYSLPIRLFIRQHLEVL